MKPMVLGGASAPGRSCGNKKKKAPTGSPGNMMENG